MELKFGSGIETLVEDFGFPGIAAIVVLPVLLPMAATIAKPLAKAAIKGGLVLYEQGKDVIAEMGETFEDIVAEAKAELEQGKVQDVQPREIQVEGN